MWLGLGLLWKWGWEGPEPKRHLFLHLQANLVSNLYWRPTSNVEPGGEQQGVWGKGGRMPGRWCEGSLRVPVAPMSYRRAPKSSMATPIKHVLHETKDKAGRLRINRQWAGRQASQSSAPCGHLWQRRKEDSSGEFWTSLHPWVSMSKTSRTWLLWPGKTDVFHCQRK